MYATANIQDRYRNDYVVTASPIDLIIMLYEGCIKQLKLAMIHLESQSIELTGVSLIKAQEIITELMKSLDMSIPMSHDLMNLYDFILGELIAINVKKEIERIYPILEILKELKDAWVGVKQQLDSSMIYEEPL